MDRGPGKSPWEMMSRPREMRPAAIFLAGSCAVVLVALLWLAGADAGAMKMLLGSSLFALASYGAYLGDPIGGKISFRRGYLVGGLTMLACVPFVVGKHSYETRGIPLPSTWFEAAMLGLGLLITVPFGAGVGGLTAVIGGRAIRSLASRRRWRGGKPPADDPLEWGKGPK